jgi:hypothetical protein
MVTSGVLALAGSGAVLIGDMRPRTIGVVGCAAILPIVALLLGILLRTNRAASPGICARRGWWNENGLSSRA